MLAARNRKLGAPLGESELEDLAQETVIAIWQRLPEFNGAAPLEAWCWGFCRVALLRKLRGARRYTAMIERAGNELRPRDEAEQALHDPDEHVLLNRALERLECEEIAVLRLKHYDEMTFEDVGVRLAISVNTAKTRYYRALSKLREFVGRARPARERSSP